MENQEQIDNIANQLNKLVDIPNLTEQQEQIIIFLFITLLLFAVKLFFT